MKRLAVLLCIALAAPATCVGPARAESHHLTVPRARRETRGLVKTVCGRVHDCVGFAVGRCRRNAASNVGCLGAVFYPGASAGEEDACGGMIRWGVNSRGGVVYRGHGSLHCASREASGAPIP